MEMLVNETGEVVKGLSLGTEPSLFIRRVFPFKEETFCAVLPIIECPTVT
jgi:hypothetical protein